MQRFVQVFNQVRKQVKPRNQRRDTPADFYYTVVGLSEGGTGGFKKTLFVIISQ